MSGVEAGGAKRTRVVWNAHDTSSRVVVGWLDAYLRPVVTAVRERGLSG